MTVWLFVLVAAMTCRGYYFDVSVCEAFIVLLFYLDLRAHGTGVAIVNGRVYNRKNGG